MIRDSEPLSIWAVGRNYVAHAKELNNPVPSEPVFFMKSGRCLQRNPQQIEITRGGNIHYEVEVGLRLSAFGFSHFCLALDLTDRSRQNQAKESGLPWTLAKSFRGACHKGAWGELKSSWREIESREFFLKQNGVTKQCSSLSQCLFNPDRLREFLDEHFPWSQGDMLLTGTPSGVGPLAIGDTIEIGMHGLESSLFTVTASDLTTKEG